MVSEYPCYPETHQTDQVRYLSDSRSDRSTTGILPARNTRGIRSPPGTDDKDHQLRHSPATNVMCKWCIRLTITAPDKIKRYSVDV